jgi:hypothetical protein
MCSDCDDWKQSALDKRDFQHSKDGPEEMPHRPKNKKTRATKQWCKGKIGREHKWEAVVWWSYLVRNADGTERRENRYRDMCAGCGMNKWNFKPEVPKHEHDFSITKISEWNWRHYDEIYEECSICGGKGRSYKFYR